MTLRLTKCEFCKNYTGKHKCKAFPKGIPTKVYIEIIEHNTVLNGQVGSYIYDPYTETEFIRVIEDKYNSK